MEILVFSRQRKPNLSFDKLKGAAFSLVMSDLRKHKRKRAGPTKGGEENKNNKERKGKETTPKKTNGSPTPEKEKKKEKKESEDFNIWHLIHISSDHEVTSDLLQGKYISQKLRVWMEKTPYSDSDTFPPDLWDEWQAISHHKEAIKVSYAVYGSGSLIPDGFHCHADL
jgi:hypothetical protein